MADYKFNFFALSDAVVELFAGLDPDPENVDSYGTETRYMTFSNMQSITLSDDDALFDDDDGNAWGPVIDGTSSQATVSSASNDVLPVGMTVDNESTMVWVDENTGTQYTMLIISQVTEYGESQGVVGFAFVDDAPTEDVRITLDNSSANGPQLNTGPSVTYGSLAVCFAAGTKILTRGGGKLSRHLRSAIWSKPRTVD